MSDQTSSRKIALFIDSLQGGGAERSTVNLANALADKGYAVDLLVVDIGGVFTEKVNPEVRQIEIKRTSALKGIAALWSRPFDLLGLLHLIAVPKSPKPLASIPSLAEYLKNVRPTAILSALTHGNVSSIIASSVANVGTRVVISQRNHFSMEYRTRSRWRQRQAVPAIRRFYRRADAIVAVSNGVADDLVKSLKLSSDNVTVIYNAVATPSLHAESAHSVRHPWFQDGQPPVILSVGKLKPQKDFPTLLQAFALLREYMDARLVVLGEGPERGKLEELAFNLGIDNHVSFEGFVINPFPYMKKANLFVLSSAYEGLPGVLIQALACGCPVVSTDCPSGPSEVLEQGQFGKLVPVGDCKAMAAAMIDTLASPPNRNMLKIRGDHFSSDNAVRLYQRVLHLT